LDSTPHVARDSHPGLSLSNSCYLINEGINSEM
jgi:hypothetical protein